MKLVRAHMRRRLPRIEAERRAAVEAAFNTTRRYAIKFENGPFPAVATLFNIGLYLLIAERDIQALKIDALTHPDEWTRKLHARMILLVIYEWDADKVTGRALQEALSQIGAPDDLRREALEVLRLLRGVQRKIRQRFGFIRNAAIAHRDPNALVQLRAIEGLKVENVMELGVEFFSAISRFITVLIKITKLSNTLNAFLRQWAAD